MPTTRADLWGRINSLCASDPFGWTQTVTPFSFEKQPTGLIDQTFRIEVAQDAVIGGFNYSEERTDSFDVWIARKQQADPNATYELLLTDCGSLTAAVVRDGSTGGGDYAVVDGGAAAIESKTGTEYAVARLALLVNYEATL